MLDVLTATADTRTAAVAGHSFRAMGTDISLVVPAGCGAATRTMAARVRSTFGRLEARLSRFRPDSELSFVNARAGRWTPISNELAAVVALALTGARATGGLFDPTILPALVAAGYDRDFEEVRAGAGAPRRVTGTRPGSDDAPPPGPVGRWGGVRLESDPWRILLPPDTGLDLGGIAKGWAADLASDRTGSLPWSVIDAGGDLRLRGRPNGGALRVAVDDPDGSGVALHLDLHGGALATSSTLFRSWSSGAERRHHIIDPRTGRSSATHVVQATAWAPTCAQAEVRSKWALLAGEEILDRLPVVLFMDDGRVLVNMGGPRAEGKRATW